MLRRNIEGREVIEILLYMWALGYDKSHLSKNRDDLVDGLADRVDAPCLCKIHGEGDIGVLVGEPRFKGGAQLRTGAPPLLRSERTQFSHRQGERSAPSEKPNSDVLQGLWRSGRGDLAKDLPVRRIEICHSFSPNRKGPINTALAYHFRFSASGLLRASPRGPAAKSVGKVQTHGQPAAAAVGGAASALRAAVTIASNAWGSRTAMSESTLRSRSSPASLMPCINCE